MNAAGGVARRGAATLAMRAWLALGLLFAIAATALVVFTEQARWLRLAVVLGLWAAVIAAFAMVRFRRYARAAQLRAQESTRTRELELQREISARREYENKMAEAAGDEAARRAEMAGLREQLERLTTTLAGLLEGDLLVERLTLSAETTRIRQVDDAGPTRLRPAVGSGSVVVSGQIQVGPKAASTEQVASTRQVAFEQHIRRAEPELQQPPGPEPELPRRGSAGPGHSAGISVADLLAAYGSGVAGPRRRRRAQD